MVHDMRIAPIALAASIIAILVSSFRSPAEAAQPQTAPTADALQKPGLSLVSAMPRDDNSIVSPFSLGAARNLIAIGGTDAVRTAVGNATGIGASSAQGLPTLSACGRQMTASARSAGISLEIANAVWPDSSVELAPGFIDAEKHEADAQATRLDLTSRAAARAINDWVAHATHDHIPTLYDGPPTDTRNAVIVTTALYFKGGWKEPFDPQLTSRQPFHRARRIRLSS